MVDSHDICLRGRLVLRCLCQPYGYGGEVFIDNPTCTCHVNSNKSWRENLQLRGHKFGRHKAVYSTIVMKTKIQTSVSKTFWPKNRRYTRYINQYPSHRQDFRPVCDFWKEYIYKWPQWKKTKPAAGAKFPSHLHSHPSFFHTTQNLPRTHLVYLIPFRNQTHPQHSRRNLLIVQIMLGVQTSHLVNPRKRTKQEDWTG